MTLDELTAVLLHNLLTAPRTPTTTSRTAQHKAARLNRLRRQHRRARNRIESGWRDAWKDQQGVAW